MLALCFGHRSRKAARAVTRMFNQRLRPMGLNISQYVLLGVIAAGRTGSVAQMADEVGVESSALLRNLKLLEAKGLVASAGGRGRNGRRLTLTPGRRGTHRRQHPLVGKRAGGPRRGPARFC